MEANKPKPIEEVAACFVLVLVIAAMLFGCSAPPRATVEPFEEPAIEAVLFVPATDAERAAWDRYFVARLYAGSSPWLAAAEADDAFDSWSMRFPAKGE